MLEFVGQTINENGKSYLDVVPAIFILIVRRLDLAYRQELLVQCYVLRRTDCTSICITRSLTKQLIF
jgi:hypothetical protein